MPGLRPSSRTGGSARLVRQGHQRHHDGDEDPLQGPQQHHARQSGQGPDELRSSDVKNVAKVRRFDQPDRVDDDHRRKGSLRHQPDEGSEEEHRQQRRRCRDELRQLRARACKTVDRGLRGPAARWHRAQERAARIRKAGRRQLLVRPEMRLLARREGAPRSNRLGETHQRDAQGPGPELRDECEVREGQGR